MEKTCGAVIIEKSNGVVIMAKLIIGDTSTKITDDNGFINITINRKITDMDMVRVLIKCYKEIDETLNFPYIKK